LRKQQAAVGSDSYVATVTPAEAWVGGRPLFISLNEDGTRLAAQRLVATRELLDLHTAHYGALDEVQFYSQMIAARRLVIRLHVRRVYGVALDTPPGG